METNIKSLKDAEELLKSLRWADITVTWTSSTDTNRFYHYGTHLKLLPRGHDIFDKSMILDESDMRVHISGTEDTFTLEQFLILYR